MKKWYQYQKERFPLWFYVPFSGAFVFSTMCFTRAEREQETFLYLWFMTLSLFFMFRIADEHKDYEEDCVKHPDRPVQRKVITLLELRRSGYLLGVVQCILTVCFYRVALYPYAVIMAYFYLMIKEFYTKDILKQHPYIYGALHQLVLILIDILSIIVTSKMIDIPDKLMYMCYVSIRFVCFFSVFLCKEAKKKNAWKVACLVTVLFMGLTCCIRF